MLGKMASAKKPPADRRPTGAAFLLTQVGSHAASRFGRRIAAIGLTPPDAGVLVKISSHPGISQQALAKHLGVVPSRMVALIDDLEKKAIVERKRSTEDRRNYELSLTEHGHRILGEIFRISAEHEASLCAALSPKERVLLSNLCRRIADDQGLTPGVHPGYRSLGKRK
jgi:DNA-binding MarR family transcriptional regulator